MSKITKKNVFHSDIKGKRISSKPTIGDKADWKINIIEKSNSRIPGKNSTFVADVGEDRKSIQLLDDTTGIMMKYGLGLIIIGGVIIYLNR